MSITSRTSLAALGLDTAGHFAVDPATLSLFAVLQLAVYGVMQIPAGLALDRFGPRVVLTVGMTLLAFSSVVLALAPNVAVGIAARVVLGAGDAMIFPSVLRVIGIRFPRRFAPVAVQATGLLGQFGQLISVIPFAALVHVAGWASGFLALAGTSALVAVLVFVVVRENRHERVQAVPMRTRLSQAWAARGTRLAFWTHFVTPFAGNTFAVLWGYPFLVGGLGLASTTAQGLFTVYVLVGILAAPLIGGLSARWPHRRVALVGVVVAVQVAAWLAVLGSSGPAPLTLLVLLAAALCVGGPGSMVAFDIARDHNPPYRLSTATGIVNGAGFLSSVLVILLMGWALRLQSHGGDDYTLEAFRWAELVQVPFWVLGMAMVIREGRRTSAARASELLDGDRDGRTRRPHPFRQISDLSHGVGASANPAALEEGNNVVRQEGQHRDRVRDGRP
ncbi:MFS transporter [Mycobacterium sp. MS1601]|uniref:MFS transporter n=1 Tax=Mycobacterium sp. MS1601 TaxID=1936029 RepID=UPI0018D2DD5A|nr:MFS transporter [Mycobacterium sp. MS1601]